MNADSEYRRGTVLGLTIAEIFILLIFLLLLALLGLANHWQEKAKESSDERDQILYEWRDILESHTPDEIKTLTSKAPKLEQQVEMLRTDRKVMRTDLEKLRDENTALHEEKEALEEEREMLKEQAEASEKAAESAEAARQAAEQKHQQARRNEEDGEVLGQDSPCWYTVVQGQDGKREKAVFIFDVRMRDRTVLVQKHYRSPPPGAHTPAVKYNRTALGRELPYTEFMREFKPLKIAGRNKQVRDRNCYFHVQLWKDTTFGETAFNNFNDYIREVFIPTWVKRDPWPH